ncbi:GNAT family N-acetyltransferase [Neiella marina]|uniref:GNAT family N-acetyltransferase n=1 Tax=Neiella holothuriorum TaxID=2870530 RepID=A0ABS7EIP7_9GAMM|nr:GNAT family N-acetyltransferase [Neiella holothuriorum]MBW8192228.1 GNAT family N-acetyltransferase [Neiella holothuriorum]
MDVTIRALSAAETLPVRMPVLRPGRPLESAIFDGDDEPTTIHIGACAANEVVGVVSLMKTPMVEQIDQLAYQLRGMATQPEWRGKGIGRDLLQACVAAMVEVDADLIWCNARSHVVQFYQAAGYQAIGAPFHIADVGQHQKMFLALP